MFTMPMRGVQTIHISEDQASHFDVGPWVRAGQALFTVVIDSGVTVNSTDATLGGAIYSSVAIDAVRSLVTIRNSGTILGCNGAGGVGGNADAPSSGGAGGAGCSGISLNCRILVHNDLGQITSGGGGGGGGGATIGAGVRDNGGGGGGNPGGFGYPSASSGTSAQYGVATGGAGESSGLAGGNCQGPATAGTSGQSSSLSGGAGGAAGIGVNSNGNGVTIVSGDANIIGGVDLEV